MAVSYNKTISFFYLLRDIKSLNKDNARLEIENKTLKAENIKLQQLYSENEHLREALKMENEASYDVIPARVIGRDPFMLSNGIILDKGTADGIEEGMAVLASGGALMGQIGKADAKHSYVVPITDAASSINVITQESRVGGILRGEYELSLNLEFIPQNTEIKINEAIITSGINDRLPNGILVGYIQDIQAEPNQLFKRVRVRPEINMGKIEFVNIIKNYSS